MTPAAPATAQPKLLVVDDVRANRLAMRLLLEGVDAEVLEAANGPEALQACVDHEFALILLDVQMPGMDGFAVASVLSGDAQTRETPIIFVTAAFADDINRLKGYQFGAVDYIAKPINDLILLSKIEVFLELWRGKQQLRDLLATLSERNQRLEEEIAERKRIEALVRHQAQHDDLTGLPNRILYLDRADTALERAARHSERIALLYLDLDGFKAVNDAWGHAAGDELLKQVAARMVRGIRKTDTVARLSGDEFAVVLEEVQSAQAALQVGRKLCDLVGAPYQLDLTTSGGGATEAVTVSVSIGVAAFPDCGQSREELLNAADAAMYAAKRAGKNRALLAPVAEIGG